ncbi:MAG: hypothetical protein ACLTSX_10735 [Collinsella sp.]
MGDAVRALLDGLTVAADPTDIACAYYRLGFYFWQGGDPSLGLACYAMVKPGTYFYGEAQSEMQELMQQSHLSRRPTLTRPGLSLRAETASRWLPYRSWARWPPRLASPWSTPVCLTRRIRSCTSSRVWMSRPTASTCSPRSAAPRAIVPIGDRYKLSHFATVTPAAQMTGGQASCCWQA